MQGFPDREVLAKALARDVAAALSARLAVQVEAMLAVSGGSTPGLFFAELSKAGLDWSRVIVTLVDDRWVPEASPRSNAALVRRHLLINNAAAARFIPLYNGAASPQAGRAAIEAQFAQLPLSLAAAVLGMGEDGHTASFFPGGDRLAVALAPAQGQSVEAMNAPNAGEPRITLTLPVLLKADLLALHIEGEGKRVVLEQALAEGPVEAMPVRAVLRHDPKIYWSP
ncbi:MAG: 6-phosphogluconolactonase [Rhodospirillales bacterium]|nr:6-phosphogluconolactonase [Rhodospirillales bacterium]MDE2391270.1 6-phosphogluconolactonase [Rhodospirillales bacterium]